MYHVYLTPAFNLWRDSISDYHECGSTFALDEPPPWLIFHIQFRTEKKKKKENVFVYMYILYIVI